MQAEHKPETPTERLLVEKMAQALWLSQRAQILQDMTINEKLPTCDNEKQLALYMRYQTTNDRAFHKCLNELLKLRGANRKQAIEFESQKRKEVEEARKEANQNRRDAAEKRKEELHKWAVLLAEAKVDHQYALTSLAKLPVLQGQRHEEDRRSVQKAA